ATTSEIDTGAGTVTYSGAITGAGAVKKSGTGKLILSSSGSLYSGGTEIRAGTITFGDVAALGSGAVTFSADSTLEAGVAGTLANAIVISNNVTGTFHTQGYNVIATGTVTGAGSLQKDGTGLLRLSSSGNTYSGGTTIKGGTLSYSDVSALGSGAVTFAASATLESDTAGTLANAIVVGSGLTATVDTKANEVTFSGNITGAGGILKKGFGILYLSGTNNSFSGGLTIENASSGIVGPTAYGVVLLANNAAGTGPLTIGNANTSIARFSLNGYDQTVSELSSGSVGIRVLEANGVTGGAISTLTVNQSTNTTYTGFLRDQNTGGGKLALVKTGSGLLDLSGAQTASTYSGGLTVNAGILGFANELNVGSGTITMGGGTLRYTPTGTTALTIPNASIVLSASTGSTIEVSDAGGTLTASGILSGAGDLAKTGAGTLILSNANTYTGDTTVSEGTLRINGNQSSATGAIAISSGATLGGTGTLGTTSITGAGQLTAGLAGDTGTIHFAGNLSTTGVTWLVDLVHQNSVDFVNVSSGGLDITGSKLLLSTSGTFNSSDPTAHRIAQFGTGGGQGLTGMFQDAFSATISEGAIINGQYRISYGQELGGYITLTAVPEPFTVGFLGLLFGGAFGFRRYRRLFRAVKEAG
ncbi:MAG: autotransporter-associated beta strand repeat-containing protein, partial [Verrucomicrobiales bacterium]|nr:autotransporter-associated beta strand repeat-containing protein [Verrucomicrobiales bacterium]